MSTPTATKQRFPREYLDGLSDKRVLLIAARCNLAARIEDDFRIWAFHLYYKTPFADVKPPFVRFVKALLASARRPANQTAADTWKAAHARDLLELGKIRQRPGRRGRKPGPKQKIRIRESTDYTNSTN